MPKIKRKSDTNSNYIRCTRDYIHVYICALSADAPFFVRAIYIQHLYFQYHVLMHPKCKHMYDPFTSKRTCGSMEKIRAPPASLPHAEWSRQTLALEEGQGFCPG